MIMSHRAQCCCLLRYLLAVPDFVTYGLSMATFRRSHLEWLKIARLGIVWSLPRLQQLSKKTFKCQKLQKCKKISFENVRDFFSLVANLLGDVVVKKSVAVWLRRTEICRTIWLSTEGYRWVPWIDSNYEKHHLRSIRDRGNEDYRSKMIITLFFALHFTLRVHHCFKMLGYICINYDSRGMFRRIFEGSNFACKFKLIVGFLKA